MEYKKRNANITGILEWEKVGEEIFQELWLFI